MSRYLAPALSVARHACGAIRIGPEVQLLTIFEDVERQGVGGACF